jgi:GNAT superfamily N-acetyltransferase
MDPLMNTTTHITIRPLAASDSIERLTALLHKAYASLGAQGLGERLMDAAEAWAVERGFSHVALDTAKPAEHLQRRYAKRGYAQVGEVQWDGKTYASVLMVKTLGEP